MNKEQSLKATGIFVLIILISNIVLFVFRIINAVTFWGIIILGALFAYKIVPWLKNQ